MQLLPTSAENGNMIGDYCKTPATLFVLRIWKTRKCFTVKLPPRSARETFFMWLKGKQYDHGRGVRPG